MNIHVHVYTLYIYVLLSERISYPYLPPTHLIINEAGVYSLQLFRHHYKPLDSLLDVLEGILETTKTTDPSIYNCPTLTYTCTVSSSPCTYMYNYTV